MSKKTKKLLIELLGLFIIIAILLGIFFKKPHNIPIQDSDNSEQIVDVQDDKADKQDDNEDKEDIVDNEDKEDKIDVESLYYYVNFLDDDGTVLQRSTYKYGTIPSYKGATPYKVIGGYDPVPEKWDLNYYKKRQTSLHKREESK